jgi:flavin reductase (DIM6/NTAB) family NADH-FMN oxidoreductase RutF
MEINKNDISSWDKTYRLKFINSISGYKGVHLIGTKSKSGNTNAAIFNSIVHIGSNPPQLGFIMRPLTVERDTYKNIIETGYFTINHVNKAILKQAHYTSTNFDSDVSEFNKCNLGEEYIEGFGAPFVKESKIKIGLKFIEDVEIKSHGTHLIIGEIQHISIEDNVIEEDGQLDLEQINNVCVNGLNQYSSVKKFVNYPYARQQDLPNFYNKERPDNVVFDKETQKYNSSLLPYGTNIGSPSIAQTGLSRWKNNSVSSFNHSFNDKIETIKKEYQKLIDEYQINEIIYNAKMNFEPIVGQTYHLYAKDNIDEHFLSMIPPSDWKKEHLGSFKLKSDKVWQKINDNNDD